MSLENDLKETFMKHAEDVRPDVQSWPTVEKKVRRGHTARVVTSSTLTVALIVAAAIVLPRLASNKTSHGFINKGKFTPVPGTPAHSIRPVAGKTTFVDEQGGWLLQYPTKWKEQVFSGDIEFQPPGLHVAKNGASDTVFVTQVMFQSGNYQTPFTQIGGGAHVTQRNIEIGGMPALELTITNKLNGQMLGLAYQLDWTHWCAQHCAPQGLNTVLVFNIASGNPGYWRSFGPDARAIANSIRPLANTGGTAGPVRTRYGSAQGSFTLDPFSATLIAFMDERLVTVNTGAGSLAETYMCCQAPRDYLNRLYVGPSGGRPVSYVIQYDPNTGTGSDHRIGVIVTYSNGTSNGTPGPSSTQGELIDVVRQSDGTYKIASMCTACGEK